MIPAVPSIPTSELAVATSTFDPTSITGLSAWWKADSLVLSDGAAVTSWADSSGNSKTATQATGTRQPLYVASATNGKPAVDFDGSDDRLDFTSFTLAAWTVIAAYSRDTDAAQHFLVGATPAGEGVYVINVGYRPGAIAGTTERKASAQTSGWTVATWQQAKLFFNGTETGYSISNTPGTLTSIRQLGARGDGFAPFDGKIAELLIFDSALSTTDRQNVERYLGTKYAVTVA